MGLARIWLQICVGEAIWKARTSSRIRRRGTRVWGLERAKLRPDLDLRLELLNAVHALPVALSALESGVHRTKLVRLVRLSGHTAV